MENVKFTSNFKLIQVMQSIRERIFNPTKHEKTVARTSNPFAQTSFKGNVLTADVFVSENAKEKQNT